MILKAFLSIFRKPKAAVTPFLLLLAVNFAFGLLVTVPFRALLTDFAEYSQEGASMARAIDMDFFFEFLTRNSGPLAAILKLAVVALPVYLLAGLFISAGYFHLIGDPRWPARFWDGAARGFWPFLRALIWCLPLTVVAVVIVVSANFLKRQALGDSPLEEVAFRANLGLLILALALIFLIVLTYDYARAHLAAGITVSPGKAVIYALRFVLRHPLRTIGFGVLCLLCGAVCLVVYRLLVSTFEATTVATVAALFVLQQSLMASRQALRLIRYSGTVEILLSDRAASEIDAFPATLPYPAPESHLDEIPDPAREAAEGAASKPSAAEPSGGPIDAPSDGTPGEEGPAAPEEPPLETVGEPSANGSSTASDESETDERK